MSKQREALELALDAFDNVAGKGKRCNAAIAAIKKALAEPEPWTPDDMAYRPGGLPMSAERQPLTDEDISAIVQSMSAYTWDAHMLARAIERAHGIGGEG